MFDRIKGDHRGNAAFNGNSLGSVLWAIETGLGTTVLSTAATLAYDVEVSKAFAAEVPMTLSVDGSCPDGSAEQLLEALIEVLAERRNRPTVMG